MATSIKVENLSKIYRLGEIGTGTISRDIERFVKTKILKQEDPFLKIGETNDRAAKGTSDIVYSLKDINFEIEQGDAVGIIGRNGAGKSTLLKILSRVTSPTTGKINIKGRVASLLEVGTGFHPELTGRENIFLNGAILGMRKREIDRKLDEIIDFSGVERYIDTPVKRYSSGMYVRLAFAVAAHLESEILIVDEVLAVGDAEFQKKCLGKMGEVSKGEGRTVLFVSHNMAAVSSLCNNAILLTSGSTTSMGEVINVMSDYTINTSKDDILFLNGKFGNSKVIEISSVSVKSSSNYQTSSDLLITIEGKATRSIYGLVLGYTLWSQFEYELIYTLFDDQDSEIREFPEGHFIKSFKIPANTLAEGRYRIQFDVGIHNVERIINDECDLFFTLENSSGIGRNYLISGRGRHSLIRPKW
jgi:lipopolysaccharide transport system ATP-binding protein